MMTTASRIRRWEGPALFGYGFRPFFFFGAVHAALMLMLWVPWYLGAISLPSALPPVAWHMHELLFGYVPAIVAGFLLTAVPNWTGRLPVVGWPLAGLFGLWVLGRLVIGGSALLSPGIVAALSLLFPLALGGVIAREIIKGKNWRNLKVLGGVTALFLAQALFHLEIRITGDAVYAHHLAVAATLVLIMVIGGRVVPSFTTNWLRRENPGPQPTPFNSFDKVSTGFAAGGLAGWVISPAFPAAAPGFGIVLIIAGVLQFIRQARWQPHRTLGEPLVTVLHAGYFFVPLGFLLAGCALLQGLGTVATGATHAWTVGAIGLMTLAMMTRATRGHTGQSLTAPMGTVMIYVLMALAAFARIWAALMPEWSAALLSLAGIGWVGSFLLFAILYGPLLLLPRKDGLG
jgi:uncharacterized protein involved in response to NO